MHIGIFPATTDFAVRPDELARACEERGFESFWVGEHTHIPASRKTPAPGGGELQREYFHLHDQFVAMTAAAAVTDTIKIGSGVSLVIEHDPIVLAKQVASLDIISEGRVLFGIGGGWNAEEMENHGTPFDRRWKVLRERIEAMKCIWTEEEPAYHGEFVNFDPIWCWPKPLQDPHPPIIMGSNTPRGRQRVVNYCDGWMPQALPMERMQAAIDDLHQRAEAADRDPASIELSVFWPRADEATLRGYEELGAARAILGLPAGDRDSTLARLDRYAALVPVLA